MKQILKEHFYLNVDREDKVIKEAIDNNQDFIISGIIQAASTLNANGRIYPRHILEREVANYKKIVAEKRAWGECVEEGSKVLTLDGWKDFRDVSENEYVYTLNQSSGQIEIQSITDKVARKNSDGFVYHFSGRNIDIRTTKGHKFALVGVNGKMISATAEEVFNNRKRFSKYFIPKLGNWTAPEGPKEFFTIDGVDKDTWTKLPHELRERYSKPLNVDLKVWAGFMGIYLSEGDSASSNSSNEVRITQNAGDNADKIRLLLSKFPKDATWRERERVRENGKTKITFFLSDARLHRYLHRLGVCYDKYIPKEVKMLPPEYLDELIQWFVIGDGRTRNTDGRTAVEVFSTSRRLVEDLHEVLIKSGGSGNIQVREPYDRMIEGRLIKKENQQPLHILHLSTTRGIYLDERFVSIEKEDYDGNVYCVTVPNETFYCMSPSGKSFWSHNCDHPDRSIVEYGRTALRVVDIWWEGNNVMGKIKILPTRYGKDLMAIFEDSGVVGISSRGVGSTKREGDNDVVQDDFQIVCWDIVAEPSTPGAVLTKESKEVPQNEINEMVSKHTNKSDRIYRICNRILKRCDTHSCEL